MKHTISTTRITPMYTEFDYVRNLETASFAVFLFFPSPRRHAVPTAVWYFKRKWEAKNKSEADKKQNSLSKMSKVEKAASLLLDTLLLILFCVAFAFRRMEEHYEKIAIDMITKRSSDEYVDLNGIMAFITISNSVDGSLVICSW